MKFSNWLKEYEIKALEGVTDTSDVAHFAQRLPIGSTRQFVPNMYPDVTKMDDPNEKRKKRKEDRS